MNPLLQNIYMVVHPPSLYIGFVGMTIPYAFGMAALITGHLDDSWLRAVRRWTMVSWLFLSLGLTLGMIWAYEELGWGGYWGWDPVENAGLLPWFTASAFLHSVIVQERRGMLKVWNVSLVIITFFLTIFGTFMTRSGVVQSVHAFGEDRTLTWMFTVFMVAILLFSFAWVIKRLPLLKPRYDLDSWVSREAAFVANNWILLIAAMLVLFGTMFPTLSEALTGNRLTVGPPFFNRWMAPIGLILLLLTGVAPLLAWRRSTLANLRDQFLWPVLVMAAVAVARCRPRRPRLVLGHLLRALRLCRRHHHAGVRPRGPRAERRHRHRPPHGRRRPGDARTPPLRRLHRPPRHRADVPRVRRRGLQGRPAGAPEARRRSHRRATTRCATTASRRPTDAQKQMVTGHIAVTEDGKSLGTMYPARWFYRKHEDQPTTEVAIRRTVAEDLYLVMPAYDINDQSMSLQVVVKPLVNWIWAGFGLLVLGTGLALLPERAFAFALSRAPAEASLT